MKRAVAIAGLVLGLAALILQFSLSIPARLGQGHDLLDALVWFFTYFTILTNLMLVLIYLSELVPWRWLGWWRSPVTRGMMAAAIALVMGFYHFVLAGLWAPEGWFHVADVALHYATPILYLVWWVAFNPADAALHQSRLDAVAARDLVGLGNAARRRRERVPLPHPRGAQARLSGGHAQHRRRPCHTAGTVCAR